MSDGGGQLDPVSAVVAMIILSILGYAAYDSLIRSIKEAQGEFIQQQNTLPVYEYVDPNAPILVPQQ
jgi:hypothetical protein